VNSKEQGARSKEKKAVGSKQKPVSKKRIGGWGDTLARRPSYARRSGLREGGSASARRHGDRVMGRTAVTVRVNYLLGKADLMYNDSSLVIDDFFRFYLSIQGGK
jgi:hypothetical protein